MPHTMKKERDHTEIGALIALFLGAVTIGAAGILVRLAETGPMATAFWRGFFALPLLAVWAILDPAEPKAAAAPVEAGAAFLSESRKRLLLFLRDRGFLWTGLFFAGDLVLWHESLLMTSVAAATLEACLAPLVVVLFAWLAWKERPTSAFLIAIALAVFGMVLIVSPKLGHGSSAFLGDAFGLATACFFGAYILSVAHLRGRYGTGAVMFNSTVVFTVLLFPLALTQKYLPSTTAGWAAIIGYAVAAHAVGQGLVAYALAHLRPTFSSLGLLVETLGAAVSAWVVLGEKLAPVQIVGGLVIVGGIALARSTRGAEAHAEAVVGSASTGTATSAMAEPAAAAVAINSTGVVRD